MDASMGGRVGPCPPPPWAFFFTWGLFRQFFATFSSRAWGGGGLFGLASPPYENFCGRPCSGVVGNFSCGTLSWHYGYISYRYRTKGGGGGSFIKG